MQRLSDDLLAELKDLNLMERENFLLQSGFFNDAQDSKYAVVYERNIEGEVSCISPSINWLKMAMHGDLLPPVDVWNKLKTDVNGQIINGSILLKETIPAMTEEEAIEYLVKKDLPKKYLSDKTSNRSKFKIVYKNSIPPKNDYRNAWRYAA